MFENKRGVDHLQLYTKEMSIQGERRLAIGNWASMTPETVYEREKTICIRVEIDGRISESSIPHLDVCPWENQERIDKLPKINAFQTFESNVYWFKKLVGEQKQRCSAQHETGEPLHFYVASNAWHETGDKNLQAYVLEKGKWKEYETKCEGKYLEFRSEIVDAFFILGTTKEIVFTVPPSGYHYVHESDKRIQLDFPEGAVQDSKTFKIKVFSVKVEEMRRRREQFPNQYAFLSVTKAIEVEGAALSKPVQVQLPLENIENREDVETEFMFFHIDGDTVKHLRNQEFEKLNDTIVTYVDKFSGYQAAYRKRSQTFTPMEIQIIMGKVYQCKLLTFMKKISEQNVLIWCEIVKVEDWESLKKKRLDENERLHILPESDSPDIFLKERNRVRVEVKGNSKVAALYPKNAMCIVFYPISGGMHIPPLLEKITSIRAPTLSTITYTLEPNSREVLHTVTFNPWSTNNSRR